MPWRQQLRRAAFRGVEFYTRDRSIQGGRRIKHHEYPKRSTGFAEDMGRRDRLAPVDAYCLGANYMAQRDRLLAALEREGAGSYVDHWGISMRVKVESFRLMETSSEGRMCRFDIDFIEDGGIAALAPVGIVATAVQLSEAASSLAAAAVQNFAERFSR